MVDAKRVSVLVSFLVLGFVVRWVDSLGVVHLVVLGGHSIDGFEEGLLVHAVGVILAKASLVGSTCLMLVWDPRLGSIVVLGLLSPRVAGPSNNFIAPSILDSTACPEVFSNCT